MTLTAAPSPTRHRLTREDVLAMGKANQPWKFVPIAIQVLRQAPTDDGVRFLLAMNYARLAMRTCALEQIGLISAEGRRDAAVGTLSQAAAALPEDRIPLEALATALRANLDVLASRSVRSLDLLPHLHRWRERAAGFEWFRLRDGSIQRRACSEGAGASWLAWADFKGGAAGLALPHLEDAGAGRPVRPYTLEGTDPPWIFERLWRETPAAADGSRIRINIVQEDPLELLDGLAQADLRGPLGDSRVRVFVGPGAAGRLLEDLRSRFDERLVGPAITAPGVRTLCSPTVEQCIRSAAAEQGAESIRLRAEVERLYAGRDTAYWRERFGGVGGSNAGRPLRVLIPTCRYSTFIQHASRDLAAAFTALGHEARVLIEPEECAHLGAPAYLRAFAEFQPDLVVLINYTRANINRAAGGEGMIPANVPFICWVQDAMPHLFDAAVGAAQTPLDFLVGNLRQELFRTFGFSRSRALDAPIPASETKFHPGPVSPADAKRHECELAYVSHHSLPPRGLHEQKVAEARRSDGGAVFGAVLEDLYPEVLRIAQTPLEPRPIDRLRTASREAIRRRAGDAAASDERTVTHVLTAYAMPVADRALRHESIRWAADLCREHGWRMHLYGRGWETVPEFAALARGELPHGDGLRVSYRSARAHMQVSLHTAVHQRIMECALAGGLPICRLHDDDLSTLRHWAAVTVARRAEPDACDPWTVLRAHGREYRMLGYRAADHPDAADLAGQLRRIGAPLASEFLWLNGAHVADMRGEDRAGSCALRELPPEHNLRWLMGELDEFCFVDREGLRRVLKRAVEDPLGRDRSAARMSDRVKARCTHPALAHSMIDLVRCSLAEKR